MELHESMESVEFCTIACQLFILGVYFTLPHPHNFKVTYWPSVAPQGYFHEAQPANSVASVYRVIPEQYAGSAKWHCVTVCQHCSLSAWPTHLLAEVAIHKLRLPMFYATPGIYSMHHPFVPFSPSFLQAVCFVHNFRTVHNCLCVVSQKGSKIQVSFLYLWRQCCNQ